MMSQNDVGSSVPRPTQPPAQPQGDFYEATAQPNIVASSRLIDTSRSYSGSDDVGFVNPKHHVNRHAQLKRRDPRSVPAMASSASQPPRDMEPAGPTPPSFAACTNDGGTGYVIHDHAGQACSAYDTEGNGEESCQAAPIASSCLDEGQEPSEWTPLMSPTSRSTSPVAMQAGYKDGGHGDDGDECCSCIASRWVLSIIGFLVFTMLYALRFNVSVAVVAMAGNVTEKGDNNGTIIGPEFNWSKHQQGYLNSAFFYGYMAMSLPGGWLAAKYGSHRTITVGMFINSVLCLVTPPVVRYHLDAFIGLRVLQGLSQAVVFPAFHALLGKWAPAKNLALMASIAFSGVSAGVVLVFTAGSELDTHGFGHRSDVHYSGDNWPSIFYVFGSASLLVTLLWAFFVYESPAVHPRISRAEREMIETAIAATPSDELRAFSLLDVFPLVAFFPASIRRKTAVPWRSIFLSVPVWAMAIAQLAADFGNYTLLTCVPTFIYEVVRTDIFQSGAFSALPYICQWAITVPFGFLVNSAFWQHNISFIGTRKICTIVYQVGCATFLIVAAYSKSGMFALAMVTVSAAFQGLMTFGSAINHVDLSPRFAGILYAYTNFFSSIAGIIGPYIADVLTPHKSRAEWRIVFFITAGVYLFGALSYGLFASAERQPWADGEVFEVSSEEVDEDDEQAPIVRDEKN